MVNKGITATNCTKNSKCNARAAKLATQRREHNNIIVSTANACYCAAVFEQSNQIKDWYSGGHTLTHTVSESQKNNSLKQIYGESIITSILDNKTNWNNIRIMCNCKCTALYWCALAITFYFDGSGNGFQFVYFTFTKIRH